MENAGTISGATYSVKLQDGGTNRLIVDAQAVFNGAAGGGANANSTLELGGGSTGTISGLWDGAGTAAENGSSWFFLMNLSSQRNPSFKDSYDPANSHVDLFGTDPYPCRTELQGCDYDMIDRYIAAATSAGIPLSRIVPVYQSFGGGKWSDGDGGRYLLPTPEQAREILARWQKRIGTPEFDVAYSWGSQRGDQALETAPELQDVFLTHNHAAERTDQ